MIVKSKSSGGTMALIKDDKPKSRRSFLNVFHVYFHLFDKKKQYECASYLGKLMPIRDELGRVMAYTCHQRIDVNRSKMILKELEGKTNSDVIDIISTYLLSATIYEECRCNDNQELYDAVMKINEQNVDGDKSYSSIKSQLINECPSVEILLTFIERESYMIALTINDVRAWLSSDSSPIYRTRYASSDSSEEEKPNHSESINVSTTSKKSGNRVSSYISGVVRSVFRQNRG